MLTFSKTLDALNELISSGNVWDSAVNEAMMLIENEERRQVPPGFVMMSDG